MSNPFPVLYSDDFVVIVNKPHLTLVSGHLNPAEGEINHPLSDPVTGRRRQIRKHMAHIRHPVIGDTQFGDVKCKRYFRERGWPERLMLHAVEPALPHPVFGSPVRVHAQPDSDFLSVLHRVGMAL